MDWKSGDPLPNEQNAEIDIRKLSEYSMNPDNPRNLGKWMAFEALGYNVQDPLMREIGAQEIIGKIRDRLSLTPAIQNKMSSYGIRFEVQISIQGINGRTGTLITIWQFDNNSDVPRLITNWLEVHQ